MALSHERALDLARRIADRLAKTPGVEVTSTRETLANRLLHILLEWDREAERIAGEVRKKLLARPRTPPEGSREWDLLFAEEYGRVLAELAARGE